MDALTISDLREMARRHLPRGIFEYVARGTDEDQALKGNAQAFDEVKFVPRVVRDESGASPAVIRPGHDTSAARRAERHERVRQRSLARACGLRAK